MEYSSQPYTEALLDDTLHVRKTLAASRRWKAAAATAGAFAVVMAFGVAYLSRERASLEAQLQAQAMAVPTAAMARAAARPNPFVANVMTCTPPGKDKHDNDAGAELSCCAGLVEVETPCRGTDVCIYCQPAELAPKDCTKPGMDMSATGTKLPCCPGLTETTDKCPPPNYVCHFCIPSTLTPGPRATYPPAKISVDPLTPKAAVEKYYKEGMSLIFSDEFKDMARTKSSALHIHCLARAPPPRKALAALPYGLSAPPLLSPPPCSDLTLRASHTSPCSVRLRGHPVRRAGQHR